MSQNYWGPSPKYIVEQLEAIDAYIAAVDELRNMEIADVPLDDRILAFRENLVKKINKENEWI